MGLHSHLNANSGEKFASHYFATEPESCIAKGGHLVRFLRCDTEQIIHWITILLPFMMRLSVMVSSSPCFQNSWMDVGH